MKKLTILVPCLLLAGCGLLDAGQAPPFNGVQAAAAAQETILELWPNLTDAEREDYIRANDAFSTKMVEAAPEDAQKAFAQVVAREWAKDL